MLDNARKAVRLASGRPRGDLDADELFGLAMTRLLEIIGEAAGRVSPATRQRYSEIPWPSMAGMRNRLIHGYDAVDFDVVWRVLQEDLPVLIRQLESALATFPGDSGPC